MPSSSIRHVLLLPYVPIVTWDRYYADPHFTDEEPDLHKRISNVPKAV